MGPIYSYLIAWIAGGVLLASGLLLERGPKAPAGPPSAAGPGERDARSGARSPASVAGSTQPASTAAALSTPAPSTPALTAAAEGSRRGATAPLQRPWFSLLWLGLLAFGGLGLMLEALGALQPPLRPVCATGGGLTVFALGWLLLLRDA